MSCLRLREVSLHFSGTLDRKAVIEATDLIAELVDRPRSPLTGRASRAARDERGRAHPTPGRPPASVVALLRLDGSEGAAAETIDVLEHYGRATWLREDVDGETNRSIRATADREAADGPDAAGALF